MQRGRQKSRLNPRSRRMLVLVEEEGAKEKLEKGVKNAPKREANQGIKKQIKKDAKEKQKEEDKFLK